MIPDSITRIEISTVVTERELALAETNQLVMRHCRAMAEKVLQKLINEYITVRTYPGGARALVLDVYVVRPDDVIGELAKAWANGYRTGKEENK
jgi:hypothetical protein